MFSYKTNLEEVTISQQQQVLVIVDELKQLERHSNDHFARFSALATDLLNQFKSIQIQKWNPGKYYLKITLLNLVNAGKRLFTFIFKYQLIMHL